MKFSKKLWLVILPVFFTAQACNFLFGDIYGNRAPSGPQGVFRSVDSGSTWAAANQTSKAGGLATGLVRKLFIEAKNPKNLLTATQNLGVVATDNGADKWAQLLPNFTAYDVLINPTNAQEIFVAGAKGTMASILRSVNRGGTWTEIFTDTVSGGIVTVIVQDRKNSGTFYAGLSTGKLIKSQNGGATWNAVSDLKDRYTALTMAADATLYGLTKGGGLYRSTDGGQNWNKLEAPKEIEIYFSMAIDGKTSNTIYLATDKSLLRSDDSGQNWAALRLPTAADPLMVTTVAVNPQNSQEIFATVRSTVYHSTDRGATWKTALLPTDRTIYSLVINPTEPNKLYVGLR